MKFRVHSKINLHHTDPTILFHAIEPENQTMPDDGKVATKKLDLGVEIEITGIMTIGRLMNTIDDIIKTAILADEVRNSTEL